MITIEPYEERYLPDLYAISLATGHMGGDASHLYTLPELMGQIYSAPYAMLEPSLVMLAMDERGVAGYIVGVADTRSWEERLEREWWPKLREKYPEPAGSAPSDWNADEHRIHMIHHPSHVPASVSERYPAHLHMNLLQRAQGSGLGLRLLEAWIEKIARFSPSGAHVGVNRQNERAIRFWSRAGFRPLDPAGSDPGRTLWMGRNLQEIS